MKWIPYIEVRSTTREIIGLVEGAEIFFEYAFHESGEFEIYCRATPNNLALLQKDNYITLPVNVSPTDQLIDKNNNMWVIEKIHRDNSRTGGRWITVTGREAKQIVDRRIIKSTQILNAKKSLVEQVKTKLFDKNLTIANVVEVEIGGYLQGDSASGIAFYEFYPLNSGLVAGDTFIYQGETATITTNDEDYRVMVKYGGAIANANGSKINVNISSSRRISGFVFNNNTTKNESGEYVDSIMNINIDDETQVTYDNLFDYTEALYLTYGVGAKLRLNRDTKEMLYTIYKGENKSNLLVFSRGNENLLSTDYTEDWTAYKNTALVGGEEEEKTVYVTDPETGETINTQTVTTRTLATIDNNLRDVDRREVFIDARDLSYKYEENGVDKTYSPTVYNAMLKSRGLEKLASENNLTIEFTGEIDVQNDRYKFNIDYYLGDIVKVRDDDFGTEILVRISKFVKVQNDDGYKEYFEYEKYEEV